MSPQQIFDMIKEYNQGDVKETIESVVELLENLRNDTDKYIMKLDNALEEFADDNNVCCICGEELQFKSDESLEEYQGSPVGNKNCPIHGYID